MKGQENISTRDLNIDSALPEYAPDRDHDHDHDRDHDHDDGHDHDHGHEKDELQEQLMRAWQ